MKDEIAEIYEELMALDLPAKVWALIAKLNNLNEMARMEERDRYTIRDEQAERRRAADRERARVRRQSADSPQIQHIIYNNTPEGGRGVGKGETNPQTPQTPRKPIDVLAPVLGADLGRAVVEHRQKLRAPLTLRAAEQLAKRLQTFPDPKAAAEKMLEKGWKSIELDWLKNGKDPPRSAGKVLAFRPEPPKLSAEQWKQLKQRENG